MTKHKVVSSQEWLEARTKLLVREKEFTRARDRLTAERRELPWEAVEKEYVFAGPEGTRSLADLFEGKSQLVVYHAMFDPDSASPSTSWTTGAACEQCSFWADNFNGIVVHLAHRDVTMIAVSRASAAKIAEYRKRMGWSFKWYSLGGSTFNFDYQVSFKPEEVAAKKAFYNYTLQDPGSSERERSQRTSRRTRRARSSTPTRPTHAASTW